jgi:hypothetical protein
MKTLLLFLVCCQTPDSRGEVVTTTPAYRGERASAPIGREHHIRNEGGSDGAGLCVYSSVIIAGAYQGVADLDRLKQSQLWRYVKARPGGSYPEKLARDLNAVYPLEQTGERWSQYTGTDTSVIDKLSRAGYPVCSTMDTGALYEYRKIHHMITLAHYRKDGWVCVVDNNNPGKFHWMPAKEYDRRAFDGGTLWLFWWHKLPAQALGYGVSIMAAVAFLLVAIRRRWATPVAAVFMLSCMVTPSQAQQCGPAGCVVRTNHMHPNGVYVMYPQNQTVTSDWADTYKPYTDRDGRRYLTARVTSGRYGIGTLWFQPDAWSGGTKQTPTADAAEKAEKKPIPKPADNATNYGVQIEKLREQPRESIITNDPEFNPNATLADIEPLIAAPPVQGQLTRLLLLPAACAVLLVALFIRFRNPTTAATA